MRHRADLQAFDVSRGWRESRLRELIDRCAVRAVFQPIVDLQTGALVAYESLSRTAADSGFANATALFDTAEEFGLLWDLERVARLAMARAAASSLPGEACLFFNASPQVIADECFVDAMAEVAAVACVPARRFVIEVTERSEDLENEALIDNAERLKRAGFQIAVDDVGAGTSGLNRIMALRPHWLKLDGELVRGVDGDGYRQNLINFFASFARMSGVRMIAEGIERAEELAVVAEAGVAAGQGYLLGRPGELGAGASASARRVILDRSRARSRSKACGAQASTVASVMRSAVVCGAEATAGEALAALRDDGHAPGVAVMDAGRCVGWASRASLEGASAPDLGRTVLAFSPGAATTLDPGAPLTEAIELNAARVDIANLPPLVVVGEGGTAGAVSVHDLLRLSARIASGGGGVGAGPVAGLPGRAWADQRLGALLRSGASFEACALDIIDFHRFNRAFGYDLGDVLLRLLAGLVACASDGSDDLGSSFAAHLGDDRFLLVAVGEAAEPLVRPLVEEFERSADRFLRATDEGAAAIARISESGNEPLQGWGLRALVLGGSALEGVGDPHSVHGSFARLKPLSRSARTTRSCVLTDRTAQPGGRAAEAA